MWRNVDPSRHSCDHSSQRRAFFVLLGLPISKWPNAKVVSSPRKAPKKSSLSLRLKAHCIVHERRVASNQVKVRRATCRLLCHDYASACCQKVPMIPTILFTSSACCCLSMLFTWPRLRALTGIYYVHKPPSCRNVIHAGYHDCRNKIELKETPAACGEDRRNVVQI